MSEGGVSAQQLAEIETRLNAATPGPWRAKQMNRPEDDPWFFVLDAEGRGPVVETVVAQTKYLAVPEEQQRADVDFIAHAPADVAALVEHVKELRAALRPLAAYVERPLEGAFGSDPMSPLFRFAVARVDLDRAAAVLGRPGERPA